MLKITKTNEIVLGEALNKRATFSGSTCEALAEISKSTGFDFSKVVNTLLIAAFESGNTISFNTPMGERLEWVCDSVDGKTDLLKFAKALAGMPKDVVADKAKSSVIEVTGSSFSSEESEEPKKSLNDVLGMLD
jgi:hypothetical protein